MGSRIKFAREKRGLRQHHLANDLGVSVPTVSDWERGVHEPSRDNLMALARFLDCGLLWLMEGDKNPLYQVEAQFFEVPKEDRDLASAQAARWLKRWSGEATDAEETAPKGAKT